MARALRVSGPGAIHHIISRCNNEEFLFFGDSNFHKYREIVRKHKKELGFRLFHYAFMHNHTHLQIEMGNKNSISEIMQHINGEFASWYNAANGRKGHFWQTRFKSTLIEDEEYFLRCGIYIELNPVRAGLVNYPQQWGYSSVRAYTGGENNGLVDISPVYLSLGANDKKRVQEYRRLLFEEQERAKTIGAALSVTDREQIRQILRRDGREPIPFKRKITKLFGYSVSKIKAQRSIPKAPDPFGNG